MQLKEKRLGENMDFYSAKELLDISEKTNRTIAEIMIEREVSEFEISEKEIIEKMRKTFLVMKDSCHTPIKEPKKSIGGLIGGEAKKLSENKNNFLLCGKFISKAMTYALAVMELNASMGVIVAAPTAGSAGVVPAGIVALYESLNLDESIVLDGLFTAGAIGYLAMRNASVSGAEAGCQAEVGMASAMTAAALTIMQGGDTKKALDAASICLSNLLGLVCDPVAGLVESPCQNRNVIGVMNAISASQLVLSGIKAFIPLDQMIEAMYNVGKSLPSSLRETALGGCATTEVACNKCKEIFG